MDTVDILLNEVIDLLEAEIPANPASEKNETIEKGMQKSLEQYFHQLDDALDWNTLEQIYYRHTRMEQD